MIQITLIQKSINFPILFQGMYEMQKTSTKISFLEDVFKIVFWLKVKESAKILLKLLVLYTEMKNKVLQHKLYNYVNAVGPGGKKL